MKTGLVSVVIPIYNVEKFLDTCILSVVNQTYHNLEILLIDDGSPDNCPQLCDDWALKDSRIRVIHKANGGLGMARNTGIEYASGEYICFFDSDDFIAPDTIEKAYSRAKQENADAVVFGLVYTDACGNTIGEFIPKTRLKTYVGEQVVEEFLPEFVGPDLKRNGERQLYMSAWVILYSMEIIQKSSWRFVSEREIISEDVYSLLNLCTHLRRVAILPEALYCYRTNEKSLSRRYISDRYERIRNFYLQSVALCEELEYNDEVIHRLSQPYLSFTIAALKQVVAADNLSYRERKSKIVKIMNDEVLQQVLEQTQADYQSLSRKILFLALRKKWYPVFFLLVKLKEHTNHK